MVDTNNRRKLGDGNRVRAYNYVFHNSNNQHNSTIFELSEKNNLNSEIIIVSLLIVGF